MIFLSSLFVKSFYVIKFYNTINKTYNIIYLLFVFLLHRLTIAIIMPRSGKNLIIFENLRINY